MKKTIFISSVVRYQGGRSAGNSGSKVCCSTQSYHIEGIYNSTKVSSTKSILPSYLHSFDAIDKLEV